MRELTHEEIGQVSGGLGLITGAIGSVAGGLTAGGYYAISHPGSAFSWGELTYVVGSTAASGFLMGSGISVMAAAVGGTMKGASVLGVSLFGAGAAVGVTAPMAIDSGGGKQAGSED